MPAGLKTLVPPLAGLTKSEVSVSYVPIVQLRGQQALFPD